MLFGSDGPGPNPALEVDKVRLAEAVGASGGRIAGLGRVDPTDGERAVTEARRCHEELGFVGLFPHPMEEAFPVTHAASRVRGRR